MKLACGVAISLMIYAESNRYFGNFNTHMILIPTPGIHPFHSRINQFFKVFLKPKETGLSLSSIYLLVGSTIPLWVAHDTTNNLLLYSGIIVLGVGDTAVRIYFERRI